MSEKNVYRKRFYDLEKEENWLNEMCAGGLVLKKVEWGIFTDKYVFDPCSERYVCRIDYTNDGPVLEEITSPYTMFVTGTYEAEFICCANGKLYFRKAEEKGDFPPIYTSLDSRIAAEKKQLLQNIPVLIILIIDAFYIFTLVIGDNFSMRKLSDICFAICTLCFIPILATIIRHALKIRSLKKLDKNGSFPPVPASKEPDIADVKKEFKNYMIFLASWIIIFLLYLYAGLKKLDFSDLGSKQFVSDFAPSIILMVVQLGFAVYYLVLALRRRKKIKELEKSLTAKQKGDE